MYLNRLIRRKLPTLLKKNEKTPSCFCARSYNNVQLEEIPEVTQTKIRAFLKKQSVQFEDGYTGFLTACPNCHKGNKATASYLYINKTTGTFLCACCKQIGAWNQLEGFLTKKRHKNDDFAEEITKLNNEVKQNTVSLSSLRKEVFCDVLKAFTLPVSLYVCIEILVYIIYCDIIGDTTIYH